MEACDTECTRTTLHLPQEWKWSSVNLRGSVGTVEQAELLLSRWSEHELTNAEGIALRSPVLCGEFSRRQLLEDGKWVQLLGVAL